MKNKNTELFFRMDPKTIPWNKSDPRYSAFWEKELEKVERGVNIDGYHLSGWLYWHINHWKLMADVITDYGEIIPKEITPTLRDNEIIINEEIKLAEKDRKGIVIMGLRQFSKDLLNSSKLYQEDKEITIGDCKVGDKIYDDSGKLTTIIGKYPQGVRPVYELSLLDGRKIMCGQDHNWYVYDRLKKQHVVKTTKELLTNYKSYRDSWKHRKNSFEYRYYIPNNQPVTYEEKELPIDPYILGCWLGDGHSSGTTFTNIDKDIVDSFQKFSDKRELVMTNFDNISYRISTGIMGGGRNAKIKNTFLGDLRNLNVLDNKHIPDIYIYSSIDQRLALLQGLMDTDGYSCKNGTTGYCTTSKKLADSFYKLCRSLGIILNRTEDVPSCLYKGKKSFGKLCYKFNLFTDLPIFRLERKLKNQNTTKKRYKDRIAISNIEYKFNDETTCITVDNDSHLFLTDNYTVTHNTSMESSYAGRAAIIYPGSQNLLMGTSTDDLNNLTQVLDYGLLNCSPYFRIPRISRDWDKERVLLGYKSKQGDNKVHSTFVIRNTAGGTKTEKGAGVSNLKCNIWDEIGKNDFLQALVGTKPAMLSQFGWRCIPICVGTGGNVEKAKDAKKLFFNPSAHTFIEHTQSDGRKTGLFLPGTLRQDCKYKTSLAKYLIDSEIKVDISDDSELWDIEILVSDEKLAKEKIEKELADFLKDGDLASYNRWRAYYPLNVDDVFLSESHNNFPIDACKAQKKWLELNYTPEYVDLFRNEKGKVDFKYSNNKPINIYPVSAKDLPSFGVVPVVIHEHPDPDAPFATYTIGCLPPGEKVMTQQGLKNIEEVTVTDNLINKEGQLVNIINLQQYLVKDEDLYTLQLSNTFRKTSFTKEHPILTSKNNPSYVSNYKLLNVRQRFQDFSFDFNKVADINITDWIQVPNIYNKELPIDMSLWDTVNIRKDFKIENPLQNKDFWWFVGLFLGDGYCVNDSITISINKKETIYIEKYKKVCENLFNRKVNTVDREGSVEMVFRSKVLSQFLFNNFGKYADGKYIPEWVKYINKDFKLELLRGYINSDGCIYLNKKTNYLSVEYVSINLELLESIQDILFSLGFVSSLSLLRRAKENVLIGKNVLSSHTKECYNLRLSPNESTKLLLLLDIEDDHKINKVKKGKYIANLKKRNKGCFLSDDLNYIYFQITSIEKTKYSGFVYNFECDTHTYMCHHITTHNCDPYNENESSDKVNSTGSIYVRKRMYKLGDQFSNKIVAHWTGRCKSVGDFHELCLMLCEYYNAIEGVLPENEDKTLIQYFLFKKKGLLFAKALDLSKEINANTKSNRLIGLSAATPNQNHYMNLLVEEAKDESETIDEEGNIEVFSGVSKILDPMLLNEYIEYRGKDSSSRGVHDINCDRIVAYGHALTLAKFYDIKYPLEATYVKKDITSQPKEIKIKTTFGDIRPKTKSPFNFNKQTNRPRGINFI